MSDFLNEMKRQALMTETINGATAYSSTQNAILDLFAELGAMRNVNENKIIDLFDKAYKEDALMAMKCLFYYRDIRGGQGERRVFRVIIKHLAEKHPDVLKLNLELIPTYGRYDDLLVLLDTPVSLDVLQIIKVQLEQDITSKHPSLLAKWMPSCNTSSSSTKEKAAIIRRHLGLKEKEYRKVLSTLREKIKVTERLVSQNRWDELDLEKLTSNNYLKYSKSFRKHIFEQWDRYLSNVQNGSTSIKSQTLYPYNIVNKVKYADKETELLCDELWKALPDYSDGQIESLLCMVDVSGSMDTPVSGSVTAMDVAISLGLYVSERVKGAFNNYFMTFSERPQMVKVSGETLRDKTYNMRRADWGMSTDLVKAFRLILDTAIETNATQDELPKKLVIISDMQFNRAFSYTSRRKTLLKSIEEEFKANGYEMPTIVFWNVDSKKTAFQVSADDTNVLLCSGCSPVILRGVLKYNNPMELVMETLNSSRYDLIKIYN